MSFLQPWMLWATPIIALPLVIHLIHKRRQRVVAWGAMMFLLQSAKMSRGMQRLRHFLLLTLRTLAVAGLIIGLGRPLAGGWLGSLGGGRPDTVLVLLDRSASMSEQLAATGQTKLRAGVLRISEALANIDAARLACIDSVTLRVTELASAGDLVDLPLARESAAQADIAAMLEVAAEHLRVNAAGRAEIWICSDGQVSAWQPDDGRWSHLEQALVALPAGVRVNVLTFGERAADNLSVRVERAERVTRDDRTELVLDIAVHQAARSGEDRTIPLAIHVAGARSVVQVELAEGEALITGHRMAIDPSDAEGWGHVELPVDSNVADNRFYFSYGAGAQQETVIAAADQAVRDVLRFAALAPTEDGAEFVERTLVGGTEGVLDLTGASLLLWQGVLPAGDNAAIVERFAASGGRVVFLPPSAEGAATQSEPATFLGTAWGGLEEFDSPLALASWRHEGDLLRDGADGIPLSTKALRVRRLTAVIGDVTPLAVFEGGAPLLSRVPTARGGVYFLATSTAPESSNMAEQGVVLVATVHRALGDAAAARGSAAQQDAGAFEPLADDFEMVSESGADWLLSETLDHSGVVRVADSFVALNRSRAEDFSAVLVDERLEGLMPDVEMSLVAAGAEPTDLVEEIWRAFLLLLLAALVAEALLCLPESAPPAVARSASREVHR